MWEPPARGASSPPPPRHACAPLRRGKSAKVSRLGFQGYEKQKKLAKNARQPGSKPEHAHGGGGGVTKVKRRPSAPHSKKPKPKRS